MCDCLSLESSVGSPPSAYTPVTGIAIRLWLAGAWALRPWPLPGAPGGRLKLRLRSRTYCRLTGNLWHKHADPTSRFEIELLPVHYCALLTAPYQSRSRREGATLPSATAHCHSNLAAAASSRAASSARSFELADYPNRRHAGVTGCSGCTSGVDHDVIASETARNG